MLAPLKKGDPVRVRLASGEVVVAQYIEPLNMNKCHRVSDPRGVYEYLLAINCKPVAGGIDCRFIAPAIHRAPMGVSND